MVKTHFKLLKYLLYALIGLLLCVLQNTPGLFVIAGAKPMLVAAFAVAVAMFEGEFAGAFAGAAGGMLCDIFSYYRFGYYALLFFFCCFWVGVLVQSYLKLVPANCCLFTFLTMLLGQFVAFFFTILIRGYEKPGLLFVTQMLPLCLYTALAGIPAFYGVRYLHRRFQILLETE